MPHLQLKDIPAGTHDVGKKDTWEETRRKMREGPRLGPDAPSGAELVRQGREEREKQILDAVLKR